ncbi:hypothetical protein RB195_020901 [Necator americanus]
MQSLSGHFISLNLLVILLKDLPLLMAACSLNPKLTERILHHHVGSGCYLKPITSVSLSRDVRSFGDVHHFYLVDANVSRADSHGARKALESSLDNFYFTEEQKCCRLGYCMPGLYDQAEPLLPTMKNGVHSSEILLLEEPQKKYKIVTDSTSAGRKWRNQQIKERWRSRIPLRTSSGDSLIVVMPLFLIVVCLICAVGFFNICRDDLMDELHSSGIDVIRSEEGGVKQAPREYEF